MEYYAIYLPYKEPDLSIKSFYNDKEEALKVLKSHKEARLKAFRTSEEAVYFYLNGPTDPVPTAAPKSPTSTTSKLKLEKTPFKAPKSQELVAFRKNIEKNELDMVRNIIQLNPRYLVSSGDTPTILKEGPRYNALHVAAMEGNTDMCKLILQTIEQPAFIEFLHGQRNPSTDEVSAILLDLYLNTPDKCRSETPLHFAAKYGSVGVVEVLISYPQCKMTNNSDGHLPKDIICNRAKSKNDTPEIRKAIADLLRERFFVPVLRAVDNSTPPVVGEPFTLTNPPNLEAKDKFSPKLEIKAYAGPMDREKAQVFCKRWKTPPRLIPSPRFISPVKAHSSSKIPVSTGANAVSPLSSTPIARKSSGRRTLFPNRSFELDQDELDRNNSLNNNFEIDVVKEDVDQEALEEQRQQDEKNGNSLAKPGPPKMLGGSFGMRMSPVKRTASEAGNLLFRKYRERLQNSFATIYDENDDDEIDGGVANETEADRSVGNGEGNYSYFCDENNSFYEGTNITESPSFKERKLRLTDTEKGLEIIGRNLAEDHDVGWNEYWNFLGTFADLRSNDGLQTLEDYLKKRQQELDLSEQEALLKASRLPLPVKPAVDFLAPKPNDSLGSICDALDKMSLGDALKSSPQLSAVNFRKRLGNQISQTPEPIRSKITNPYLCLHNSLQVFAKRFVKNLDESITTMTMDFGTFFQQAVVDCVRKLNTMVDNYRKDAAFGTIDFTKVHSRYAQLIVINIEQQKDTAPGVIHRLKILLDKSRELNSALKFPDLYESLICLQNFLDFYVYKKTELMKDHQDSQDGQTTTEASCSRIWRDDPLVHCCNCRIDGAYAKKGSLERLNKRREQRKKQAAFSSSSSVGQNGSISSQVAVEPLPSTVSSIGSTPFDLYRNPKVAFSEQSDEEEEYFSCSDSELDTDSDSDDPNVTYETPPSSPSFFSEPHQRLDGSMDFSSLSSAADDRGSMDEDQFLDSNGDLEDGGSGGGSSSSLSSSDGTKSQFRNFIEGPEPSKQDVDVLNVLEKREIDESKFPYVHQWRKAMLKLSVEEKERLSTKISQKSRWRTADVSGGSSFLGGGAGTSPPGTPIDSISKVFRTGLGPPGSNESLSSLDGRLSLMNISDYANRKQQLQQPRIAPAQSS